jgi:hypothetical protein
MSGYLRGPFPYASFTFVIIFYSSCNHILFLFLTKLLSSHIV